MTRKFNTDLGTVFTDKNCKILRLDVNASPSLSTYISSTVQYMINKGIGAVESK